MGPVFQAGFNKQYTKVVKLARDLSHEQRQGRVGEVIAKAYVKLIMQRMKSGQLAAAAKQSAKMFEQVSEHIKDVDLRRFNRILKEMEKSGKKHGYAPVDVSSSSSLPLFKATEGALWTLVGERKLLGDERPDPAFIIVAIDARGTWLIDYSGVSAGCSEVKSVLRRMDRDGCLVGEKALHHDAYRTGTGGSGIAIMDSGGLLHVYDVELNIVTESNLREDSRVVDHFQTIDTNYWGDFKSQVRAVDVAPEGDRYLFTLADEAWCCTTSGDAVWGVVMPLKEGWKRIVGRSERFGVAQEVEEALRLFGLTLPIDPSDIKRKYRKLVQVHHPDRNAGDPAATEKMKILNTAFEILTGVDPNTLEFEESDITYFVRTDSDYVMELEGLGVEINMTGEMPQDWVYAASFSAVDGGVYLATYSGKVILISREGRPEVVYDIGTCPKEIVDVGRYTYFLTSTRLYIIENKTMIAAFLDVFQQGRLLVTQTGFGLLTEKQLQWFTHAGVKVGELTAKNPIRAIYGTDSGAIVQTRQHQVEIHGLLM
ncbi:MAG: DnaJ domain-containing protein [Hydrogenovibrio sp.]|uniref:J domain-containing protein n=1 Tax=Hydrogenovibrio sp. TaxID=2065821 RepID=UPI0028707552|nr:DnaJ domain-containing protein [Hydrogenovibrio sp.]MDR9498219.1 DnaJ domain-containing protein [Hydrogenovibrio sp.]